MSAAESDRHVAGLGEVEQARVAVVPRDGEVAADERDRRAGARWALGRMRRRGRRLHEPGGVDGDGAEGLGRDALGRDATGGERGADGAHEALGAAQVVVGVLRDLGALEDREVEPSGDVVVGAERFAGARPAVGHARGGRAPSPPSSASTSAPNACSSRLRAPCTHQTGLVLCSRARACSIASTGVAPTPALMQHDRPGACRAGRSCRAGPRRRARRRPSRARAGSGSPHPRA